MKKLILIIYLVGWCSFAQSQNNIKHINWSIVLNEKLLNTAIAKTLFELKMADSTTQTLEAWAYAGNIEMSQSSFDKILLPSVAKIWLKLSVVGVYTPKSEYKIRVYKSWLNSYFMVLKIYDLRLPKYRKIFVPRKDGKPYVYDVFLPARAIQRLRKK
jgi:hypothetical protein